MARLISKTVALGFMLAFYGGCVSASPEQLRDRAAFDLACPKERVELVALDPSTYGVTGCGQRATYVEMCNGQPGYAGTRCTWVLNSDRPVGPTPSVVPAPGEPPPQSAEPTRIEAPVRAEPVPNVDAGPSI